MVLIKAAESKLGNTWKCKVLETQFHHSGSPADGKTQQNDLDVNTVLTWIDWRCKLSHSPKPSNSGNYRSFSTDASILALSAQLCVKGKSNDCLVVRSKVHCQGIRSCTSFACQTLQSDSIKDLHPCLVVHVLTSIILGIWQLCVRPSASEKHLIDLFSE